jgi:hypothetical protein
LKYFAEARNWSSVVRVYEVRPSPLIHWPGVGFLARPFTMNLYGAPRESGLKSGGDDANHKNNDTDKKRQQHKNNNDAWEKT